jgi:hypothetical protein
MESYSNLTSEVIYETITNFWRWKVNWSCAGDYATTRNLADWNGLDGLVPDEPDGRRFADVIRDKQET